MAGRRAPRSQFERIRGLGKMGSRQRRNAVSKNWPAPGWSGMTGVVENERFRTGMTRTGDLGRAFNIKYPNRGYSTKLGPNFEEGE